MNKKNTIDGNSIQSTSKKRGKDSLADKLSLNDVKIKNPYNCHKASAGKCDSYPVCGCQWSL